MLPDAEDDGSRGALAFGKFLDGFRTTIEQDSADVPKEVFQLLLAFLREYDHSNEGSVWLELQSDDTFKNAWIDFDDKFNDCMAVYDDAPVAAEVQLDVGEKEDLKRLINTMRTALTKRGF